MAGHTIIVVQPPGVHVTADAPAAEAPSAAEAPPPPIDLLAEAPVAATTPAAAQGTSNPHRRGVDRQVPYPGPGRAVTNS